MGVYVRSVTVGIGRVCWAVAIRTVGMGGSGLYGLSCTGKRCDNLFCLSREQTAVWMCTYVVLL